MKQHTILIEGMSCKHCIMAVEKAVGALPGIVSVKADLETNSADVKFNDSDVSLNEICDAVEKQGYTVTR